MINTNYISHTHLGSNADAVPEQLINTALLITETPGEGLFVVDSTYYILYINKATLCPRENDVHHISEYVLNSLEEEVKLNQQYTVWAVEMKGDISQCSLIYNIFTFICWYNMA
jgi:hypothetical protein